MTEGVQLKGYSHCPGKLLQAAPMLELHGRPLRNSGGHFPGIKSKGISLPGIISTEAEAPVNCWPVLERP